ncbi:MAG: class I SAM-dependent methyltransferase [Candidatus Altiarchaeota archaeon]
MRRYTDMNNPNFAKTPKTKGVIIKWANMYDSFNSLFLRLIGEKMSTAEAAIEKVELSAGIKVLDVGCGTGTLTIAAKHKVGPSGEVHGVDASPQMIGVAKEKAIKVGLDVAFQVGVVEGLTFPDSYFDIVLSCLMIHHLPGDELKQKAFTEIYRVLKPGGNIFIADFEPPKNVRGRLIVAFLLGHTMEHNDIRELPSMLEKAGFTHIETGQTKNRILSFVRGVAEKR